MELNNHKGDLLGLELDIRFPDTDGRLAELEVLLDYLEKSCRGRRDAQLDEDLGQVVLSRGTAVYHRNRWTIETSRT